MAGKWGGLWAPQKDKTNTHREINNTGAQKQKTFNRAKYTIVMNLKIILHQKLPTSGSPLPLPISLRTVAYLRETIIFAASNH